MVDWSPCFDLSPAGNSTLQDFIDYRPACVDTSQLSHYTVSIRTVEKAKIISKARFKRRTSAVPNSIDRIKFDVTRSSQSIKIAINLSIDKSIKIGKYD